MKILVVSPVFWPENFRVNDFALHLVSQGHQVEVLAGHPNYPEGRYFDGYSWHGPWTESWRGLHILRFPQFPRGRGQSWRLALQYLSYVVMGMVRLLMSGQWDWDAVFVFQTTPVTAGLPALFAGKLSDAWKVIWVQDLWPDSLDAVGLRFPTSVRMLITKISSVIYSSFDAVVGQNEAFLPRLRSMGVEPGKLSFVSQWADEETELPRESVQHAWDAGFTILFAGNLGKAQGLESVLEAAEITREAPGLQWVFMGDGSLREMLEREVVRRGLAHRVIFPGRKPSGEMPAHYARADALLVCLRQDPVLASTLPGKVQACLAAGKPILGAVEGVTAKVIEEAGAGLVVPPDDPEALAEAALRLMHQSAMERARMGAMGRDWYSKHYSKEHCIMQLEEALHQNHAALK